MENYNNIAKTGTIGGMVDGINANFQLTKEMLERLSTSKEMSCGLFADSTALNTAYPSPTVGMWALVGDVSPFAIYRCSTDGTWEDTGETYTSEIDLTDYLKKEDIETQEEISLSQYTKQRGYYPISGNPPTATHTLTTSSTFATYDIPVTAGQRYRVNSHNGGAAMAQIIFWNGTTFVSFINRGDNADHDQTFEIPTGVTEMSYCFTDSSSYSRQIWRYIGLDDVLDDMQTEIEQVQESMATTEEKADDAKDAVDAITETIVSPNLFDKTQVVNQVIGTSGSPTTVSGWAYNICTGKIPVESGKVYCISGCGIGQGFNIRCLAADRTTVMKVLGARSGTEYSSNYQMPNIDATGTASSMNGQFKTPNNAAYVQFNIGTNADYTNTTMLELVGDAYDSAFVPSAYQPYGSETKIKEEALPEGIGGADLAMKRKFATKVLLIGSSHGRNTISQFPWVAYKSGFTDIVVGNFYLGSVSLSDIADSISNDTPIQHTNSQGNISTSLLKVFSEGEWSTTDKSTFDAIVTYKEWDFIILQRSASEDETWTSQQSTDFNTIVERIKAVTTNAPTILFNSGFADPSTNKSILSTQHTKTRLITDSANEMSKEYNIEVLPVATAIQNARNNSTLVNIGSYSQNQLCYDGQHLDFGIGCYIPAMVLFHRIFGKWGFSALVANGYATYDEMKTLIGNEIDTGGTSGAYTEPTATTMKIAKQCALDACENPNKYATPEPLDGRGVRFDMYDDGSSAPLDSVSTNAVEGTMYYFKATNTFMLKVGSLYYSTFAMYPNASDYVVTLGVTYWCGNKAYTVQGDGKLAEGLNWVGTQAQYDALTTAQKETIIAYIIEDNE